jgi:hypothetical protein
MEIALPAKGRQFSVLLGLDAIVGLAISVLQIDEGTEIAR